MKLALILITFAYLAGSVSSAIIVCRLLGLPDPRGEGSGNPGATNVLRIGGKKAAAITLIGDMLYRNDDRFHAPRSETEYFNRPGFRALRPAAK